MATAFPFTNQEREALIGTKKASGIFNEMGKEFSDVHSEHLLVDAVVARFVLHAACRDKREPCSIR